jgi:hypothetical protein
VNGKMNRDNEEQFETEIDRELKGLPELQAPASLIPRVMAALESRAAVPWFMRSWPAWPVALKASSFLLLAALFCGLCYAGWHVGQLQIVRSSASEVSRCLVALGALLGGAKTLFGTLLRAAGSLSTGLLMGTLVAAALAYATFLALAAGSYRLAKLASSETSYEKIQH